MVERRKNNMLLMEQVSLLPLHQGHQSKHPKKRVVLSRRPFREKVKKAILFEVSNRKHLRYRRNHLLEPQPEFRRDQHWAKVQRTRKRRTRLLLLACHGKSEEVYRQDPRKKQVRNQRVAEPGQREKLMMNCRLKLSRQRDQPEALPGTCLQVPKL